MQRCKVKKCERERERERNMQKKPEREAGKKRIEKNWQRKLIIMIRDTVASAAFATSSAIIFWY